MLKVIGVIAAAVIALVVAVLAYASTKPDTFRVARTVAIAAPPERIYPLVNELRSWGAWSPYETKDPDMARRFSGPASGEGASYAWDGDGNVGQGVMTIAEASPPSRIVIRLDFIRPFEAHNTATFTLAKAGEATSVTWAMDGPSPLLAKVLGLFIDMDRMIGKDFENGLANLKQLAERDVAAPRVSLGGQ